MQPGSAWHVTGSLIGIYLALAPLGLRRISLEPLDGPPRLSNGERDAFAVGVALMDPARLKDRDRDAIVTAVVRGRSRVEAALASGGEALTSVMDALEFEPRRRRALAWTIANDRAKAEDGFAMVELLALGAVPADVDLDAWGTSSLASTGCPCTALARTDTWRHLESRPQAGLLASVSPDLNLRIALELQALTMPAALAHQVISAATLEFTESVAPIDAQDRLALARAAHDVPRSRIEDYIAATAAVGGALVPDSGGSAPNQ